MKGQLIPPPELAPPSVKHLAPAEKIELWAQLVEEGDQLMLAGLRGRLGPHADLKRAAMQVLERRYVEHDRAIALMITGMRRRERADAR